MTDSEKTCCGGVDAAQQNITDLTEQGRWAVIGVSSTDSEPSFSYTVGLHYKELPELIMIGLPVQSATYILNNCAGKMINQSNKYPHGQSIKELANMPLAIIDVFEDKKQEYAIQAWNHFHHWDFSMQQLVMPDAACKFPWGEGFDQHMNQIQPILGSHPPVLRSPSPGKLH